jgi:galactose mutarotase-like enzyme
MLVLQNKNLRIGIENGEMVSLQAAGYEYIHQKGDPGWGHSDIEMFPIIGPTSDAGFRVHVPRGNAILDQHGLLRELEYELVKHSDTMARYRKVYTKATVVENSKFPEKSTAQRLIWPFDFKFEKCFKLTDNELVIELIVAGEKDMPFMLGYHPAFKIHSDRPRIETADISIGLEEIMEAGSRALELADCQEVVLKDERSLKVSTKGFGHFMLWTEVPNMICIEPITFYPYSVTQADLHEGFVHQDKEEMKFVIKLSPL